MTQQTTTLAQEGRWRDTDLAFHTDGMEWDPTPLTPMQIRELSLTQATSFAKTHGLSEEEARKQWFAFFAPS
ncbi:MAG: hypothetical protein WCV84_05015 [Patescibacteria group bacterium]